MSLGHVYIVLEPVGSARLAFDDDRYYEFMCFDVPKVVRSPGCDQGHDEESQNGRDTKNDILDDVIRTPDEFRGSSDKYQSGGRVIGTTGEVMGLIWPMGERERGRKGLAACSPMGLVRIGLGGGAEPPPSFPPPPPSFFS